MKPTGALPVDPPEQQLGGGAPAELHLVPPASGVQPLSPAERVAVISVGALVGAIAVLGFLNSFTAVQRAAEPTFGSLSYTLPLAIDLGIFAFTGLDLVLSRLDMRPRWLRLIPWTLTAATIYLNVASEPTWFGRVAHTVLPSLWVVAVEVGAHVLKMRAGLENGTVMDSIRPSRWLLAPWSTFKLQRRMILWEIRSYPLALTRERARLLALTALQDAYGRIAWRWKAPRRERVLYRLGELTPGDIDREESAEGLTELDEAETEPSESAMSRKRAGIDVSSLLPVGRQVADALAAEGTELTRDTLAAGLRAAGHTASNTRIGALLNVLRSDPQ